MKISIITATYNSASNIAECIESLNSQTYTKFDHLIIDGVSKDNTLDIINSIPNRVKKIISEKDNGIYDALNKGLCQEIGDIIGFLHSDDLLASSETLAKIVDLFRKYGVDGVYGDLQYIQKNEPFKVIRHWKSRSFSPDLLNKGWMPPHPTLFLRKNVYEKHGGFNLKYRIAADYDFMIRVLKDETLRFSYLPETITKMRVGGASNRSLKNILQKSKEDLQIINQHRLGGLPVLARKNLSKIGQFF